MRDNQFREGGFKFYELAAVGTEEGGEPRTINLCRQRYDQKHLDPGEEKVTKAQWKELITRKVSSGKQWTAFGCDDFLRKMWARYTVKKAWARRILEEAAKDYADRSRRQLAVQRRAGTPQKMSATCVLKAS